MFGRKKKARRDSRASSSIKKLIKSKQFKENKVVQSGA